MTPVYHPSIKDDGNICKNLLNSSGSLIHLIGLDVLGEKWTPNLSIVTSKILTLKNKQPFTF